MLNNKQKTRIVYLCKLCRKSREISLIELGSRTGYHYTTLSKFEHERIFTREIVEAYRREVMNEVESRTLDHILEEVEE